MSRDEPEAPWRTLDTRLVYDGAPWMRVYRDVIETGTGARVDDFHRIEAKDFVLVFAWDDAGRIAMVRQWRQGPGQFALSFPGGHVEPGEAPADAALRELAEEAGATAPVLRPLGRFCMHSNLKIGWGHFFLAPGARLGASRDNPDLETAERRMVSPRELETALGDGQIATVHDALCARLGLAAL